MFLERRILKERLYLFGRLEWEGQIKDGFRYKCMNSF